MQADFAIVGGGIVGLSVAWGLLQKGQSVIVLDGDDRDLRASRGNFGLVWVQGKGLNQPDYARWSQRSAGLWPELALALREGTGEDVQLRQEGGLDLHFTEESLAAEVARYETLKRTLGGDYPFEVLGAGALGREEPEVGPKVAGAILHHQDGHANPLRLLAALNADVRRLGGTVLTGRRVVDVAREEAFALDCADGTRVEAGQVVLAAGLGAAELGPKLGFAAPVRPERGQVLITEKMPPLIRRPSLIARQVEEGGIQIGATNENAGWDDGTTRKGMAQLAAEAVAAYPVLEKAQLVRSWGALRVMSPDGLPIYEKSRTMEGAVLVTCHSGVTLAAVHAMVLPDWVLGRDTAPDLEVFGEARFTI